MCFRMIVDGKSQLMMAVHIDDIVTSGSDGMCKHFPVALIDKIPANNLEELARHNG